MFSDKVTGLEKEAASPRVTPLGRGSVAKLRNLFWIASVLCASMLISALASTNIASTIDASRTFRGGNSLIDTHHSSLATADREQASLANVRNSERGLL